MNSNLTKIVANIAYVSLCAYVLTIPFSSQIFNIFIFIFSALTLTNKKLYQNFSLKNISKEEKVLLLVSFVYVLWEIISVNWSIDKSNAWKNIGQVCPILLYPLAIVLGKICGYVKNINTIMYCLVIGCILVSITNLTMSYFDSWYINEDGNKVFDIRIYKTDDILTNLKVSSTYFNYSLLSHFGHPSYLSMYLLISIAFLYTQIANNVNKKNLHIAAIIFLGLMVMLLSSRANNIALITMVIISSCNRFFTQRKIPIWGLAFLLILPIMFSGSRLLSWSNIAKKTTIHISHNKNISELDIRLDIWTETIKVIKCYPILGTGIGDDDKALFGQYMIDGKKKLLERNYGTHNQYLYEWMTKGIIGFLIFLIFSIIPLVFGLKRKNLLLILFFAATSINVFFEMMINRRGGVCVIPVILILLLINCNLTNDTAKQELNS